MTHNQKKALRWMTETYTYDAVRVEGYGWVTPGDIRNHAFIADVVCRSFKL